MTGYLDFKDSICKDCYRCLRNCPVKAIRVIDHQARIIEERCILCGKCTVVCPQNAKSVHSDIDNIKQMLKEDRPVIASLAPSFVSSFKIEDFAIMCAALQRLGLPLLRKQRLELSLLRKNIKDYLRIIFIVTLLHQLVHQLII